jgi:PAP2 superfamily protein
VLIEQKSKSAISSPTGKALLTLALLVFAGGLAFSHEFYDSALISAFFAMSLASSLILHLKVRPVWPDLLLVLVCAVFLWSLDIHVFRFRSAIIVPFSFLGLSSLLILGLRTVWAEAQDRKLLLYAFVPAVLFVISEWMGADLLDLTSAAHLKTLDLFLYSFDCSLRIQLSFLVGAAFKHWYWLKFVGVFCYIGLPIPIAVVYGGQLIRKGRNALPAAIAFLVTGPLGIAFYNLFPATGPIHLFGGNFPFHPLTIEQAARLVAEPIVILAPRNAIPSLHMAWVLLAWWYSRGLSWWSRGIVLAFIVFTVLSTLGTGEHYFIDLIVAFPFTLMIRALCTFSLPWKSRRRIEGLLAGLAGTLVWFALLRFGLKFFWASPAIPWAFVAATVVFFSIQIHRLEVADDCPQPVSDPPVEIFPAVAVNNEI